MSLTRRRKPFDWITLSLYVSLLIIGWLMVFAASYKGEEPIRIFNLDTQYGKQTLWFLAGLIVFGFSLVIDPRFWKSFAYPIYGSALVALVLVLVIGSEIKGSRSWFHIGGFSFQPAEYAKFSTLLALSAFLNYYKTNIRKRRDLLVTVLIFLMPAFLILLQPDAGSALVFFSFFILLFREGLSSIYYIIVLVAIALFITSLVYPIPFVLNGILLIGAFILGSLQSGRLRNQIFLMALAATVFSFVLLSFEQWGGGMAISILVLLYAAGRTFMARQFRQLGYATGLSLAAIAFAFSSNYVFNNVLKPHQQERINVWLQPELCDPRGSLYNVLQSKIAIGSGGLLGKGYLNGTMTKLNYVPEQSTDFIFCTIGEEQGFIGVAGVILLFVLLMIRLVILSERAKSSFERHYGYGLAGILFIHFIVNIGMTMGLMPIIGIPLPFLSYGGSSIIFFSLMLGVMLKFDQARGR